MSDVRAIGGEADGRGPVRGGADGRGIARRASMAEHQKYRHHREHDEEYEKEKNRQKMMHRSRMWTTVGSDEESASDAEDHKHHHSHKHRKDSKERKKSKKHKRDERDSDSDSSSSSDRKHKKKDKKHKHKHKHHKSSNSSAVNQNEFGKYGIIREEHLHAKQREFEAYLMEVKKIPSGSGSMSKREIMDHFSSFIEDYNTATMPHEKFYNYDKWEISQHLKKEKKRKRHEAFDDEELRRRELQQQREAAEKAEFAALKQKLASDKGLREDMRRQAVLKGELELAYKQGDMETVTRLQKLLKPESRGRVEEVDEY